MKLININTKQIITGIQEIDIARQTITANLEGGGVLIFPFDALQAFANANPDWVDESTFINWKYPEYRFCIEMSNYFANLVVDTHPEYLDGINEFPPNKREITPERVHVYVNNFMRAALEMLRENDIKILCREPELIPENYIID